VRGPPCCALPSFVRCQQRISCAAPTAQTQAPITPSSAAVPVVPSKSWKQRGLLASAGMPFRALWAAYNRQLQRQPVLTQVSTSAVLWGAGDLLAQQIEKAGREHASYDAQVASPPPPGSSQAPSVLPLRQLPVPARNLAAEGGVDWRRSGMTGVFGGSVVGPIGHYW
jgi:hypothetical protein